MPVLCAVALALLGCEACGSTTHDPGPVAPAPPSTTTTEPPATTEPGPTEPGPADPPPDDPPPDPPAAPEPGPAIAITTRSARGHVIVTLANDGREPARFSSQLTLEVREGDGAWSPEEGSFVASIDDAHPLPACAELVPGASLELRFTLDARDAERRFVLAACEGTGRTEGPGFRVTR